MNYYLQNLHTKMSTSFPTNGSSTIKDQYGFGGVIAISKNDREDVECSIAIRNETPMSIIPSKILCLRQLLTSHMYTYDLM